MPSEQVPPEVGVKYPSSYVCIISPLPGKLTLSNGALYVQTNL
jgi:hypothetical protein